MSARLEPVDRWDEAAQRWVTAWVWLEARDTPAVEAPRERPINHAALGSMLGPVL